MTQEAMPVKLETVEMSALESIERASIDIQISTAKKYPRQLSTVKKDMLSFATLDEETAEGCFYTLPRGGKSIQGPSVRLAEIAVACYGNLRAGARVISTSTTGDNPHVVVQAVCHDLEKNVAISIEKRRRITKKKSKDAIDEDDINLACNACAAIAFRDAVFKAVPMALIKPVYEQAKRVAVGDATTLSARREKAMASFGKMGITQDRVLAALNRKAIDEIDLADMEKLLGWHNAIKDGELSLDEAFPPVGKEASKPKFDGKAETVADAFPGESAPAAVTPEPGAPSNREQVLILVAEAGIKELDFENLLKKEGVLSATSSLRSMSDKKAGEVVANFQALAGKVVGS